MCIVAAANERSITIAQSAAQTRGTEAKEDLIVESVVINVQRHPCAISIGASLPLSLSLSLSPSFPPRPSSFSFSLHPAAAPSVSLPLIIPYLYLGPFGSQ